jgi:hypothetical protein
MIAITPDDPAAASGLLDAAGYSAHLEESAH